MPYHKYTVKLEFGSIAASSPEDAAHQIQQSLESGGESYCYEVINEDTLESTIVDTEDFSICLSCEEQTIEPCDSGEHCPLCCTCEES